LQASFPCDGRTGPPFGLEWQVDRLQVTQLRAAFDGGTKFLGELALLFDRSQHGFLPCRQGRRFFQRILDGSQRHLIESLGRFLAVAGDERNGITRVEQLDRRRHLAKR